MDDPAVTALETDVADVGALLVQLQKYRDAGEVHAALRAAAMRLGDRARALHRAETLDAAAATALSADARALRDETARAIAAVQQRPEYAAAVAAHAAGDLAALARLLPAVFEELEAVPSPPPLHLAVTWLRRSRPRPADEVVAAITALLAEGVPADGDPAAAGVDPALPAVGLLAEAPSGDPVCVRFAPDVLPAAVFRLALSDEYLVHVPVLRAPLEVVLPLALDPDELGEISLDHPRYRAALVRACTDAGLPTRTG